MVQAKFRIILVGVVFLFAGSAAFAQLIKTRVLCQSDSLKVLGSDNFPTDLDTEIYVGSGPFPHFYTKGKKQQIDSASINVNLDTSVRVDRKHLEKDGYFLSFFSEDSDKKTFMLLDLNMDGQWDVKLTPTRSVSISIQMDSKWLAVDKVDDFRASKPTAIKGTDKYEFDGKWKLLQGK